MKEINMDSMKEIIENNQSVAIYFGRISCAPCKALLPVLEKIDEDLGGGKIFKINVDEEKDLAKEYEISSIPALVYFKDGIIVNKTIGMTTKKIIMENLIPNISGDTE